MNWRNTWLTTLVLAFVLLPSAWSNSNDQTCDPRLGIAQLKYSGYTKSRWQEAVDAEGEKDPLRIHEVHRILRFKNRAIPMLISCLTDERETSEPLWDYWGKTRVGDIAFFILSDLFSDRMNRSTLPGIIRRSDVQAQFSEDPAWTAWENYIEKHTRRYLRQSWQKAWALNGNRVYWNDSDACFRLK